MKDLIGYIAKTLVDQPEKVSVAKIEGSNTTILGLSVAKSDMGKIIGKQDRTAMAIRTILSAACGKARKKYILGIVD